MRRWFFPVLVAAALAGCASAPEPRGDLATSARLDAAESLWQAGNADEARRALAEVPRRRLLDDERLRFDLLSARFALADGRYSDALALLQPDADRVPAALRADWLALRARALEATGDRFGMAAALADRAALLSGEARADALRDAERQLKGVPDAALRQQAAFLREESALLPLAMREARRRGFDIDRPEAAPAPVAAFNRPPPARDGYHPPRQMAVLLPLTGELAAASGAVRDGLLAGYYGESRAKPSITFFDTRGTPEGALSARAEALAAGADLIVGPLGRDEVAALAAAPADGAVWLALNRTPLATAGGASFALAPEDEGVAVAQRLLDQGLRRVVAIAETDDSAQRSLQGFRERFQRDGGEVLATASLDPLGGTAAEGLAILAARGAGAEALFLAARAPAARILMPQRDVAGLAGIPVFSTSLVLFGSEPRLDRELDGLQFPELPWLLGDTVGPGDADSLGRSLPTARGSAARLFAFGYDAWRVAVYLDALQGGARLRGATGDLGIDAAGIVERVPAWAEFSGGLTRRAADGALMPMDSPPPAGR